MDINTNACTFNGNEASALNGERRPRTASGIGM
jgi:hypothetical protein